MAVLTNLVPNPSGEATGVPVTTRVNLFPNPSFEAAGSALVVRTNLALNPVAAGAVGFLSNNSGVHTMTKNVVITGGPQAGITTAATSQRVAGNAGAGGVVLSAYNVDGLVNTGPARKIGAWFYTPGTGFEASIGVPNSPPVALPAGVWVWVTGEIPANAYSIAYIQRAAPVTDSDIGYITGVTVLSNEVPTETIWGARSAAGDFTYAWTGTAHGSTSTQSATRVPSTILQSSAAIRSSDWSATRSNSMRLIPLGSSASAVLFDAAPLGVADGKTYTILAKMRLPTPQTGTVSGFARSISVFNGGTLLGRTDSTPNVAGIHDLRMTLTIPAGMAAAARIVIYNGAESGDVWWDDFMLVEGNYAGPYISGATPADTDFTYLWSGTVHASASVQQAPGVTGWTAPAYNSTVKSTEWFKSGSSSIRIIPLGTVPLTYSTAIIPTTIGKTYTALGTSRIAAELTGPFDGSGRRNQLMARSGGDFLSPATARDPGVYEHRIIFVAGAASTTLYLWNGATAGDVWWDDIMLVEGAYYGPYFDGRSPGGAWTAAADASPSTKNTPALTVWDGTTERWVYTSLAP